MVKLTSLTEIYFKGETLSKCFRELADWIDENKMENNIRGAMIEQDSEYADWYVSLFLFEKPDIIK